MLGWAAIHSGRSIVVAPTAEPACRVWIRISSADMPVASGVSSTQVPVPSSLNVAA